MNRGNAFVAKARSMLGPRRILRRAAWLVRHHPRRLAEVGALVVLAVGFQLLARVTGPRTGSLGEAEMIRILEGGAQVIWVLLLPLGLVRWVGAGARSWRATGGASPPAGPAEEAEESWPAAGHRLLAALLTAILAPPAALVLQGTYAVEGSVAPVFLLLGVGVAAALVAEALPRDAVRRRVGAATRAAVAEAVTGAVPEGAVDVGGVADDRRGGAARGRSATRGLPAGVLARADFFSEIELSVDRARGDRVPFTLLILSWPTPRPRTTAAPTLLGDVLVEVFGELGAVGYLGNDLFGVGWCGASAAEVARTTDALGRRLEDALPSPGDLPVAPCFGVARAAEGRERVRDLYARALARHRDALDRAGIGRLHVG